MINTDGLGILQPICSGFLPHPRAVLAGERHAQFIASIVHLLEAASLQVWKGISNSRMGHCLQGSLGNVLVGVILSHDF